MKKRVVAALLVAAMSLSLVTGCHDSSSETATVDVEQTDYDPEEAVADFEFGELNDTEKDYVVEMGYLTAIICAVQLLLMRLGFMKHSE